ncbi:hypothetical protein R1sor_011845 [Riccia sorocarpa]|uniref:HMA domain-containing protein n=1 Tax=Riccia sorocarpa TaxID=122646 RepID=A0ABD3I5H4_9MARC
MSINPNEMFYRGYNPAFFYGGYDEYWILGQGGPTSFLNDEKEKELKGIIKLKMPLCCEGCVEKVTKKLKQMEGVASVECNTEKQKVTVRGEAKPDHVLAAAKKILPRSEFWKVEK